jgi:radical SAM superfamily enzyme YgiQ (UPF0313 family)
MKVILIKPAITEKLSKRNFKTWNIEPLSIAILKALTPSDIETSFYDDRLEQIPYGEDCDLVGITLDTSTAGRAYNISKYFRRRGIPVILGGYHPSLIPEEAIKYADSIVVGWAEDAWPQVINDIKEKKLEKIYHSENFSFSDVIPDRSIFINKRYLPISLVETSRGCPFSCEFCSTGAIYKGKIIYKNIEDIIKDIKNSSRKFIMFTDENIMVNNDRAKKLFERLIPLKIKWIGQASPNIILNGNIIPLMRKSGCMGLLIGFESVNEDNLKKMKKNLALSVDYKELINTLHSNGIGIYASFIAGYSERINDISEAFRLLAHEKVTLAGFSPLTPYPGTSLYSRLIRENRIAKKDWWMNEPYPYWKFVYFRKQNGDMDILAEDLRFLRKKFYSFPLILKRINFRLLILNPLLFILHPLLNFFAFLEVRAKEREFC